MSEYVDRLIKKRVRDLDRDIRHCEGYIEEQRLLLSDAEEELERLTEERSELCRELK
ncbi:MULTISPECIES: hypothetical protein [unclassified Sporosarcina]|uniref:hypothetical protein n=1 Tax=unclassified Sporosarcina TaxID=2647733 RepID=UPI0013045176|nr:MULTISPECIES: hypothetical protein [unclassified Sporosarcina]